RAADRVAYGTRPAHDEQVHRHRRGPPRRTAPQALLSDDPISAPENADAEPMIARSAIPLGYRACSVVVAVADLTLVDDLLRAAVQLQDVRAATDPVDDIDEAVVVELGIVGRHIEERLLDTAARPRRGPRI